MIQTVNADERAWTPYIVRVLKTYIVFGFYVT
jgi:hypothetical protein